MDKKGIAKRYASAIYDVGKASDNIGEIREVLNLLMEKYEEEEEFRKFLSDPVVKIEEKEDFLKKSFDFVSKKALRIVNYIVRKGRLPLISHIKEEFLKIYYAENDKLPVTATFTKELSENQKEKLIKKLESKYGKKVVLNLKVDKSLIGGGIVKIRNEVINGSIKYQIEDLKKMF
ncbi:ATP synthase F1 subunit delta [Leptotrichia sp. OH3620_COT-345]|uniref:ATP synthase F1 subunit delta n=1 Tax=Leptotrichia sp. OH3620_COT-345 TaxID=2491048 RepID=UPI000F655D44|nr:ATP synthase F1 subunit delta [Leptotrichia sp. OH3620_COT-345]RRD40078.1 ATP synthase F1 subunit delta [Leptotrichia sp. OH3620_COT-345]